MTGPSLLANDRSVSLWVNLSMCVFVCIDISVCHDPPVAAEFSLNTQRLLLFKRALWLLQGFLSLC